MWGVVSRVVPNGNDYTGRQNRLAHHVIAQPSELESLCPASILSGFAFHDSFTGSPHYLDREPVMSVSERNDESVWDCMGGSGWRAHIAELALATSRIVVLIPPEADGRSVVASIVLALPIDQRWAVGVVEATSAEQCWAHNVRIRVLTMAPRDDGSERAFPGEVVVDLRHQPNPPKRADRSIGELAAPPSDASECGHTDQAFDFSAFTTPIQDKPQIQVAEPLAPSAVAIDSRSQQVSAGDVNVSRRLPEVKEMPRQAAREPASFWKRIGIWFIFGAVLGALAGLLILKWK